MLVGFAPLTQLNARRSDEAPGARSFRGGTDGCADVVRRVQEVVVPLVQLIWGAATDTGRVRLLNEDSMLAAPPVFVVSDGMGGHAAGDRASAIVVEEFGGLLPESPAALGAGWVRQRVVSAGLRIRDGEGGGATVCGVAVTEQDGAAYWLAFNIGDSRVYRWADGLLEQISVDHSYVQELVDAGDLDPAGMRTHPQRNVITRAVGMVGDDDIDCWLLPIRAGERLLVCSDGITGELRDPQIAALLSTNDDPQQAADALIAEALAAGGRDNATALIVDVRSEDARRAPDGVFESGSDPAIGEWTVPREALGGTG
ncbi:MAG: protein phosphatase 2C domain-containing protein [Nakamurella sp.]